MSAALELQDVSVRLGDRDVLVSASLAVAPGEVVGLLGRNGAGKTTMLRAASGAVRPDSGRVLLGGRDVSGLGARERARMLALVPQETQVPFPFSVAEVALMGRTPHLGWLGFEGAADRAAAQHALERVGIAHLADRSILEVSGGERQLAVVARALAQDPALLLLDEPTAFLDLRHRVDLLCIVRDLAAEGRAALVVSHDLGLAARFCDRVALLGQGHILAEGPPAEVLDPARLREAFDLDASVFEGPDGAPVIVPTIPPRGRPGRP